MAGVLELIEKILNEQREVVQARDRSAIANQTVTNMRTTNAGAEVENQAKQASFRANLDLASRRYPDMDPVEALVKYEADTSGQDRDIKVRTAEQALSRSEAQAAEDMAQAEKYAAQARGEPEARAARERKSALEEEMKKFEAENMRKYGRRQAPAPQRGRTPAPPKAPNLRPWIPIAQEFLIQGNSDPNYVPTEAEVIKKAMELAAIGGTGGSAAGAGGGAPPAVPGTPGAAPPPVAPTTVADPAGCAAIGGNIGVDGKCHVSSRR